MVSVTPGPTTPADQIEIFDDLRRSWKLALPAIVVFVTGAGTVPILLCCGEYYWAAWFLALTF